jgi:hypothetical protein
MRQLNNTKIFLTLVVLPVLLFVLYGALRLDIGGGFLEHNEIGIKLVLSFVALIGSGLIFFKNTIFPPKSVNSPSHLIWLVVSGICLVGASLAIAIIWGFRHGIGF